MAVGLLLETHYFPLFRNLSKVCVMQASFLPCTSDEHKLYTLYDKMNNVVILDYVHISSDLFSFLMDRN